MNIFGRRADRPPRRGLLRDAVAELAPTWSPSQLDHERERELQASGSRAGSKSFSPSAIDM